MEKIIKVFKKVKIKNLIILIFLLIFNTYAWFIYATRVSADLSVHVSSWNVEFVKGEGDITTNIEIVVDRIYPGMETFERTIEVHNKGETKAVLDYEIESLKIMDDTYVVNEETGLTTQDIENRIKTEYPFKINIEKNDNQLEQGSKDGYFKITIEWPFDSGDDEKDTIWGNKAYEYYALNPGEKSIELKLQLIATQQGA